MKKKLVACIFAVLTAGMLSSCSVKTNLVVGINDKSIPFSFYDEDGSLTGFDVDYLREIGKHAGLEIQFKAVDLSLKQQDFYKSKVDCLVGTLTDNAADRKNMLFTKPFMKDGQVVLVNEGSTIAKKNDLKGKIVGAVRNSLSEKALLNDHVSGQIKNHKPQQYLDYYTSFIDLDALKIDAIALNQTAGKYYVAQKETQYRLLSESLGYEQQYVIAFRRNDSLLRNKVQDAINRMAKDGTGKAISQKWFGTDLTVK